MCLYLSQDQMALCGCNHRFVTVTSDKKVMATSETAKEKEMIKVHMLSNNTMYVVNPCLSWCSCSTYKYKES